MFRARVALAAWTVSALAIGTVGESPVSAHHSFAMFEMTRDVTYTGVVLDFIWRNPHVHITVEVPAGPDVDPDTVGIWDIEGASPAIMQRQGWTRASYKIGDPITLVAHPMLDGAKGASLFYVILPSGERMYQDIARPADDPEQGGR